MLSRAVISLIILGVLSLSDLALGRMLWPERDGRAVFLNPRRFGQQNPQMLTTLSNACPSGTGVCADLAGSAISTLLVNAPECSQQDMADQIINASRQFDAETQKNMIALAVQFRQVEKNTSPDFTKQPPINRNSVFCQKAPQNKELNCLVQAQDPSNNPNVFFDPATQQSVQKGSQANTFPFCQNSGKTGTNSLASTNSTLPPAKNGTTQTSSTGCNSQSSSQGNSTTLKGNSTSSQGSNTLASNAGQNLQPFNGNLGGVSAPAVTKTSNGQFQVEGNANFKNLQNAIQRSCDVQHNKCADAANASGNKGNLTVAACGTQQNQCNSGNGGTTGNQANTSQPSSQKTSQNSSTPASNGGKNLQPFNGDLGGVKPPTVTQTSNGQFQVEGNSSFNSLQNAIQRSCDVQNNKCADAANASGNQGGLTVAACNAQQAQCNSQGSGSA